MSFWTKFWQRSRPTIEKIFIRWPALAATFVALTVLFVLDRAWTAFRGEAGDGED